MPAVVSYDAVNTSRFRFAGGSVGWEEGDSDFLLLDTVLGGLLDVLPLIIC